MKTVTPFPHALGCPECRDGKVCNYCGRPLSNMRCTNGRCVTCHARVCTPGGIDGPGHGSGLERGEYSEAHYIPEENAKAALVNKTTEAMVNKSVQQILIHIDKQIMGWATLQDRVAVLGKLATELRAMQELAQAAHEHLSGVDVPIQHPDKPTPPPTK